MEILCHTVVHRLFIFLPNSTNDSVFLNWSIGLPTIISLNIYLPLINSGPLTTCFSGLKSQQQMNGPNQNCPQITSTPCRRGNAARYFLVWSKVTKNKKIYWIHDRSSILQLDLKKIFIFKTFLVYPNLQNLEIK